MYPLRARKGIQLFYLYIVICAKHFRKGKTHNNQFIGRVTEKKNNKKQSQFPDFISQISGI